MPDSRRRPLLFCLFLLAVAAFAAEPAPQVDRFGLHEVALAATGTYANPYTDCAAEAILTAPDGSTRSLPLFWDGGATWRLRLSPDLVGDWHWRIASPDAGLNGRQGALSCRPSLRRGSIVARRDASHHFAYQNGEPMWFMGDTAWSFVTDVPAEKHDDAAVARYLERRASQGFNVIHTMMLSETGDGNAGGAPFTPLADEKLNPAYWQSIDRRIAFANSRGIVMGLALAWGRKVTDGKGEPYAWGRFPNRAARERYARYIAARYGAYDVYFLVSGEWHGEIRTRRPVVTGVEVREEFIALGHVVQAANAHGRMIGIHPMSQDGSVREFNRASWMAFADYQQTYNQLHDAILTSRQYPKPVVNSEYAYHLRDQDGDGQPEKQNSLDEHDIRHASWDIAMAGGYFVTGFGTTYFGGNRDPGPFDPAAAKNVVWENQIQLLKDFLGSLDYWRFVPADLQLRATQPRGEDRSHRIEPTQPGGRPRIVPRPPVTTYWALQIPGETYVVYARGLTSPLTLVLEGIGGKFAIRQFNPRTGIFKELDSQTAGEAVAMGEVARVDADVKTNANPRNTLTVTPPDGHDWAFVLQRSR